MGNSDKKPGNWRKNPIGLNEVEFKLLLERRAIIEKINKFIYNSKDLYVRSESEGTITIYSSTFPPFEKVEAESEDLVDMAGGNDSKGHKDIYSVMDLLTSAGVKKFSSESNFFKEEKMFYLARGDYGLQITLNPTASIYTVENGFDVPDKRNFLYFDSNTVSNNPAERGYENIKWALEKRKLEFDYTKSSDEHAMLLLAQEKWDRPIEAFTLRVKHNSPLAIDLCHMGLDNLTDRGELNSSTLENSPTFITYAKLSAGLDGYLHVEHVNYLFGSGGIAQLLNKGIKIGEYCSANLDEKDFERKYIKHYKPRTNFSNYEEDTSRALNIINKRAHDEEKKLMKEIQKPYKKSIKKNQKWEDITKGRNSERDDMSDISIKR